MTNVNEKPSSAKQTKGLHRGYIVCASLFVAQMLIFFGNRSVGIVLLDIQETLGITVAQVGLISALFVGINNFGSLLWGGLTDKIGPRICLLAAGSIFSIACICFGLFGGTSYPLALAIWSIAGFGTSGLQESVIPKLVNAWFAPKKRGHAMRLIMPGGPFASLLLGIFMPIGVTMWGWGPVFVVIGFVALLCTIMFTLVKSKPSDIGALPVGYDETEQSEAVKTPITV